MKFRYYIFFILLLAACRKDQPPVVAPVQISSGSNSVLICNEGNFQFGNAGLSLYNPDKSEVTEDIFKSINNKPLGDVGQSVSFFNNKLFIVVNNSGKIEVINQDNYKLVATITNIGSPRYMLPISNSKAYVSDIYSNKIWIINPSLYTITGSIPCKGWTEEMVLLFGKAYVTNIRTNKIYVINTSNDVIEDSITVGEYPSSITIDKNDHLWVLCGGNTSTQVKSSIYCINALSKTVISNYDISTGSAARIRINGTKDTLYYINKDVYRFCITDNQLPVSAFIPANGKNFYSLGVDPKTSEVYVGDALDYVQRGQIYRYNASGVLQSNFLAGIIPGEIYFN